MMAMKEYFRWNVLLVDDEPDNIGVAETVLTYYGAKVVTGGNGEEALAQLKHSQPTVVLLDLAMPIMDGWETIRRIRQDVRNTALPVIALTANVTPGAYDRALEAGFDGYIPKPFRLSEFMEQIDAVIQHVAYPAKVG